jgi:hypothetical protein
VDLISLQGSVKLIVGVYPAGQVIPDPTRNIHGDRVVNQGNRSYQSLARLGLETPM